MKNRIYHFHPKDRCTSGITVVYDPDRVAFAVARCSSKDRFCRRTGVSICETRLKTARMSDWVLHSSYVSYKNRVFSAENLGCTHVPDDIDAVAFLLAELIVEQSSDSALQGHLASHRPHISEEIALRFREGVGS